MKDYLIRIIDEARQVRVFLACTTGVAETARQKHHTSATASAALGRLLTGALIMASDFKNSDDVLTVKIEGGGPAGTLIATATADGRVKGFLDNPEADFPARAPGKLAVGDLVGSDGYIEVTKDLGLKEPFAGRAVLASGEIAEDLANYFFFSEQIPSLVSLGVMVNPDLSIRASGGLLVQALPGADDTLLAKLESNIMAAGNVSALIDTNPDLETIAAIIMDGVPYSVLSSLELGFECNCERERMLVILSSLSWEDLNSLKGEERIEIVCHFCNTRYWFTYEEIAAKKSNSPG